MKHQLLLISALLLWLAACQPLGSRLTLDNPLGQDRRDAPVRIPLSELTQQGMVTGQPWAPYDAEGEIIPYQYDDLDQDGQPDELFFLVNLAASATQTIALKPALNEPAFTPRTHVRLARKTESGLEPQMEAERLDTFDNKATQAVYQFEGVGWENEQIAFRNYLDLRNGMDIFGKTQQKLLLDSVGLVDDDDYHHMLDWGLDILKVGSTLGAGGVAFWYQDSLIRLSSRDADYRLLFEGPLRSRFELRFRDVELGDKAIDVVHTIDIVAGTYAYDASLRLSDTADVAVVLGLVDLYDLPAQTLRSNGRQALYTYGLQSEHQDSLGMALLTEVAAVRGSVDTDTLSGEIPDTYGLLLSPQAPNYRFVSGWTLSDSTQFGQEAAFEAYLQRELTLRATPVQWDWQP